MDGKTRTGGRGARTTTAALLAAVAALGAPAPASAQRVYEVRSIETAPLGIADPSRLAYVAQDGVLRVAQRDRGGFVARDVGFDERPAGPLRRRSRGSGLRRAAGSGRRVAFVLRRDGRELVIRRPGARPIRRGLPGRFRDVSFNHTNGLAYVLGGRRLLALDAHGRRRLNVSLAPLDLTDPRALAIAPSADRTDAPRRRHLYVADRGDRGRTGRIVEADVEQLRAVSATRQSVNAPYVQGIPTGAGSGWSPPSPDPSGITYVESSDTFIVSDSEVEETVSYQGHNLWSTVRGSTTAIGIGTTKGSPFLSNEPSGLGYDPATSTLWVSDDDGDRIHATRPGPDNRYGNADDVKTTYSTLPFGITDPEGVEFDPTTGRVFVCDGLNKQLYDLRPVGGGTLEHVADFDLEVYGMRDCEGIGLDPVRGTILAVDPVVRRIYELTKSGRLSRILNLSTLPVALRQSANLASVAVAPSSSTTDDASVRSLWVVDRQVDNDAGTNQDPNENDGLLHEFAIPGAEPSPDAPVSVADVSSSEAGPAVVTLSRPDGGATAGVRVTTTAGSAAGGEDFSPVDQVVTFAAGATSATVDVPVAQDSLDEADETFTVTLSEPTGDARVGSPSTATVTILDDEPAPTISVTAAEVIEGDAAEQLRELAFTVTLSATSGRQVTFDAATEPGTATAADYDAVATGVTIPAGQTTATITVPVTEDTLDEPDEALTLRLANPINAGLGDAFAAGTIRDDDPEPTISVAGTEVVEGDTADEARELSFTATLSTASGRQVTFDAATEPGTATTADFDPIAATGITIPAGQTTATITVPVIEDTLDEPDEALTLRLANPTNAVLGDAFAPGTIRDDDGTDPTPEPTTTATPSPAPTQADLVAAARRLVRGAQRRVNARARALQLGRLDAAPFDRSLRACVRVPAQPRRACRSTVRKLPSAEAGTLRARLGGTLLRRLRRNGTAKIHLAVVVRAGERAGRASATFRLRSRRPAERR